MKARWILILIFISTSFINNIDAQIEYTEIVDTNIIYYFSESNVDSVIIFDIDMNNDNTVDFYFRLNSFYVWHTPTYTGHYYVSQLKTVSDNLISTSESSESPSCTNVFNINDIIDANSNWTSNGDIYVRAEGITFSCDIPFEDKYYAVSFIIDGSMHYGWIYLDVNSIGEILLKGYGYNTIPNELITAGQIESSIYNGRKEKNQINIYNINGSLSIKQNRTKKLIKSVSIYSLLGVNICEHKIDDYQALVNVSDIKTGIYLIKIRFDDCIYCKRVFID